MSEIEKPWTAGPWYSDQFGTVTTHPPRKGLRSFMPTTGIVAKCQQIWQERAHHDARLIAKAPELVGILETMIESCEGWRGLSPADAREEAQAAEIQESIHIARVLLNKIYGTEP